MEVILKEDVPKLGSRGDVVKVAEGYGRNFLLPAQARHRSELRQQSRHRTDEGRLGAPLRQGERRSRSARQAVRGALGFVPAPLGRERSALWSVTSSDIAEALEKKSFHIDRRKIQLHEPLKAVGEFDVPVKLHKDVTTHVKVVIEKEAAE